MTMTLKRKIQVVKYESLFFGKFDLWVHAVCEDLGVSRQIMWPAAIVDVMSDTVCP